MSELMLLGVLRAPIPKKDDELAIVQLALRAREAADEIERLRAECEALRKDAERLDYLSRNPRLAEFHANDGTVEDCVYYAVSGVPGLKLREIIDAALASSAPTKEKP